MMPWHDMSFRAVPMPPCASTSDDGCERQREEGPRRGKRATAGVSAARTRKVVGPIARPNCWTEKKGGEEGRVIRLPPQERDLQ